MQKSKNVYSQNDAEQIALGNHLLGWESNQTSQSIGFQIAGSNGPSIYSGDGHQMTIGKTGSGKAVNSAMPQALSYPGSMVILDTKGEIQDVTRRFREKVLGQKIVNLSPFDPNKTDGLNPFDLLLLKIVDDSAFDFATTISTIIAGSIQQSAQSRNSSNDVFWMDSGVNLNTGVVGAAIEGKLKEANLNAAIEALKSDDVVYNLAVLLDTNKPSPEIYREIAAFLQMTEVTRSGVLAMVQSYYRGLSGKGIRKMLGETTFDLKGFVTGETPTTIYITIPPQKLVSHARLIHLIFGTLMIALFSRSSIPQLKTLIQLDEVASLGSFDPLRVMLTMMRGQGVIAHTIFQDLAQIEHSFSDWETILNNHGVIRLLGSSNYRQAIRMADIFGVSPRKLIDLKPHEQAIFIDGKLSITNRLNYLTDDFFAGRFDANPRYVHRNPLLPKPHLQKPDLGSDSNTIGY